MDKVYRLKGKTYLLPCYLDRAVPNEARDSPTFASSLFFSSCLHPSLSAAAANNSSRVLWGISDNSAPSFCCGEICPRY